MFFVELVKLKDDSLILGNVDGQGYYRQYKTLNNLIKYQLKDKIVQVNKRYNFKVVYKIYKVVDNKHEFITNYMNIKEVNKPCNM